MSFPVDDNQYEEVTVVEVGEEGDGWSIKRSDGWSFFVPGSSPVKPEVGQWILHYQGTWLGHNTQDEESGHSASCKIQITEQTYEALKKEVVAKRGKVVNCTN